MSPILLNITYSILFNIPNPQDSVFPIQYVLILLNIKSHFQYSSIFLSNLQVHACGTDAHVCLMKDGKRA